MRSLFFRTIFPLEGFEGPLGYAWGPMGGVLGTLGSHIWSCEPRGSRLVPWGHFGFSQDPFEVTWVSLGITLRTFGGTVESQGALLVSLGITNLYKKEHGIRVTEEEFNKAPSLLRASAGYAKRKQSAARPLGLLQACWITMKIHAVLS